MKRLLRLVACVALLVAALVVSYTSAAMATGSSQDSRPASGDCPTEC